MVAPSSLALPAEERGLALQGTLAPLANASRTAAHELAVEKIGALGQRLFALAAHATDNEGRQVFEFYGLLLARVEALATELPPGAALAHGLRRTPAGAPSLVLAHVYPEPAPSSSTHETAMTKTEPTTLTIEGVELAVTDGEPKMRDFDLATRLGLAEPRMIRKLIKRYEKSGDLGPVDWRSTVERQLTNGGGHREYRVTVAWLTEEQVLFLVAKSETATAVKLTKQMIHVFMLARRGLLTPPAPAAVDPALFARLAALEASQAQTAATLATLPSTMALAIAETLRPLLAPVTPTGGPCIGRGGALAISGALKMYGDLMANREGQTANQWARKAEVELRAMVSWTGSGSAWASFPMARWPEVKKAIETLHTTAGLVANDRLRSAQLPLPSAG